jgi:thioredoxin reductase (NADPH)
MGPDLMTNVRAHAVASRCQLLATAVAKVSFDKQPFTLTCDNGATVEAEAVIIACGSSHKKLGCPGEERYWGSGVSVCATCDAPFYKNKEVVVVGGGNSAVVEADHLAHVAKKVTIVHMLDQLTATDSLKFKVLKNPKISVSAHTVVKEIQGDASGVTQVLVEDAKEHTTVVIPAQGVFVAIGMAPNTQIFKGVLDMNNHGYLNLVKGMQTSVPGVFAAGEVADSRYRQAITSAGFGCMAALDCQAYLTSVQAPQ